MLSPTLSPSSEVMSPTPELPKRCELKMRAAILSQILKSEMYTVDFACRCPTPCGVNVRSESKRMHWNFLQEPGLLIPEVTLTQLGAKIDEGSNAKVYACEIVSSGTTIKAVAKRYSRWTYSEWSQFFREVSILNRMQGVKGVPRILGVQWPADRKPTVFLTLGGHNLCHAIYDHTLNSQQALKWVLQIVDVMIVAQNKGVTHKDLKPGNCVLVENQVMVIDWASGDIDAKPEDISPECGTYWYRSPEQAKTSYHNQ